MPTIEASAHAANCDPFLRRAPLRTTPEAHDKEPILPSKHGDDPSSRPAVRSGADYARRPVEWLWHKRIPVGKVTLLCGDPGLGKSLVALDVAARVTTGAQFPATACSKSSQPPALPGVLGEPENDPSVINTDESIGVSVDSSNTTANPRQSRGLIAENAVGSVLVLTNEDDIADTIRPRFEALGGDLRRIFFDESITNLRDDFARLVETLDSIPDCRLIIVDPVNAFVGPSDSHFHTVVRRVLKPLADLAKQRGIAILAVTHLRKSNGATIQRAAGTMGFVGFARTVWTISRDGRDPKRRVVVPAKNNLGPTDYALAYSIAVHQELDVPMLAWEPQPLSTTDIEEATAPVKKSRGPEAEERRAASVWLTTALTPGPRNAGDLIREGKEEGYNPRTLRRGLEAIGGRSTYHGMFDGWRWSIPRPEGPKTNTPQDTPKSAPSNTSPNAPSATKPPQTRPATTPPTQEPSAESVLAPEATAKKPVPLKETCPLTENTQIPTSDNRPRPVLNGTERTLAAPPPGNSVKFDDDLIESSLQILDALKVRRRKPDSDPAPMATTPTTAQPRFLNGHPSIGQIAALAEHDQAQPTDLAPRRSSEPGPPGEVNSALDRLRAHNS